MDDLIWSSCAELRGEAERLYERFCPDGRHREELDRVLLDIPGEIGAADGDEVQDEHAQSLFDAVGEFFTKSSLRFSVIAGEPRFLIPFRGQNAMYLCFARVDEEDRQFVFHAQCPVFVPDGRRSAVTEYLTRANYGLILGNFEMDLRDGEVRYKTSIDVEGHHLNDALLRPLVYANISTIDRYMPGLFNIVYQGTDPESEIAAVESGPS